MKIDHFIQSELRVIASENVDISSDLNNNQDKNINELLDEKTKTESEEKENKNSQQ